MKSLIKSKKGGIPAINEIVMTFLQITPTPILLMIFILLITTIAGVLIPIFLNMFGYVCVEKPNTEIGLYQIPLSTLSQYASVELDKAYNSLFGAEDYILPDDPFPNGDKTRLRIPEQCMITSDVNGSNVHGYISACVECDPNGNFFQTFLKNRDELVCESDGFPNAIEPIPFKKLCSQCSPPYPYYYNHTNCITEDECYFTIINTTLTSSVSSNFVDNVAYERVLKLGGVEKPQDDTEFANIQCTESKKPSLFFFSIELFNKTMWILLIVGYFLVMFAFAWYGVVLK